jgi:hypothetical protein
MQLLVSSSLHKYFGFAFLKISIEQDSSVSASFKPNCTKVLTQTIAHSYLGNDSFGDLKKV